MANMATNRSSGVKCINLAPEWGHCLAQCYNLHILGRGPLGKRFSYKSLCKTDKSCGGALLTWMLHTKHQSYRLCGFREDRGAIFGPSVIN